MSTKERAHSPLGPSSAHRWIACPPSVKLSQLYADKSSNYAAIGTEAHMLAEYKIRHCLGLVDKSQCPIPNLKHYDAEMDDCTTDFAVYVLNLFDKAHQASRDPELLLEERLDYSTFVPEGFGTCDVVIAADYTAYVSDFKYGQGVLVSAERNPQLMLYALGLLEMYGHIYDIEQVHMSIFQPRREHISTTVLSVQEIYDWAETILKPAAQLAYRGEGECKVGDHCQFCRARAECRARAAHNMKITRQAFRLPPLLTDEEIESLLEQLDGFISWAKSIQDHAFSEALKGKKWQGFKLVSGRANRVFTDKKAVEETALAAGYSEIYKKELLPLTALEKALGKEAFNKVLGEFVTKPPGKPTLVPESDKRTALDITSAAEAFSAEPIEEEDI